MKLLIGIATYKRIKKLERCIESIKKSTYKNILQIEVIIDNNDYETLNFISNRYEEDFSLIDCKIQPEHKFVIGAWNRVIQENMDKEWGGFIGLCDDVELRLNALEEIVKYHKENFPNTDGVCGFAQECYGNEKYTFKEYGQTLMGRKFIERYKEVNYQICCPFYKHFKQDREMYQFASFLNKFKFCSTAILDHDHPSFTGNIDETHNIIREGVNSPKKHDFDLYIKRNKENKIWGKTWEY